ncbi:hypothetical protein SCP_0903890 [Sparassis crispa]|uniref:Zn(2)-C6 fungal-type domain-containing protein n=1 Tax=Sparassis crispa TaxID=139825 RepID=A0A401GWD0_9APHY|nr:hypothetical protein SCP_0903890 [Sparassis crispa]GBE86510.1 hypothetical protein SCP_0903890 [Sparassis crispa]
MSSTSSLVSRTKRRNAPLSCAECRRLKLKCSRVFPCSSCVKKGCAAICPDGSLTTGKGNRFVLANTEVLHEKITILANRVRQLEDALAEAHNSISHEPHTLLSEELLQIKRPLEREAQAATQEPEPEVAEAIDAVGSLSITESGHTTFFGTTANAWYLLQNEEGDEHSGESPQISLPTDIPWLSHTFPFSPSVNQSLEIVRASILDLLPEASEAHRLAEIYYRHAGWMYTPVPKSEFYGSILSRFYESVTSSDQSPSPSPMDAHKLAIVFMVMAMGTLLDLEKPQLSPEATRYYQLGRAALSLDSILESQSIAAIQALILMCHFMFLSFVDGPRWALMGIAVKLAQSLGLHRDSGKWNLDPHETTRRRALFYELHTYDSWQSLTFGRPPSFATAFIDCQFAEEPTKTDQDETEMSFAAWKHRFSSRCLNIVHEQAFGARVPSYRIIQNLDKKVREFYVPPSLRVPGFGEAKLEMDTATAPVELTMQRYIAFAIREITIFYIHRGYFARAVEDHPDDPLGSKYAPSVLAAYNSACSFVALVKSLYSQHPGLTQRMWFHPCLLVRDRAGFDTNQVSKIAVSSNPHAAKVLPVLQKLKGRALVSVSEHQSRALASIPPTRASPPVTKEDEEFAALGGKTRLVSRKSPSLPSSPSQAASSPRDYSPRSYAELEHTPPPAPDSVPQAHIHQAMMEAPTQWQGYEQPVQDVYDYPPYQEMHVQWPMYGSYEHMQPAMVMDPAAQYSTYQLQDIPMQAAYIPQEMAAPPEAHVHSAWSNLFAQYSAG